MSDNNAIQAQPLRGFKYSGSSVGGAGGSELTGFDEGGAKKGGLALKPRYDSRRTLQCAWEPSRFCSRHARARAFVCVHVPVPVLYLGLCLWPVCVPVCAPAQT